MGAALKLPSAKKGVSISLCVNSASLVASGSICLQRNGSVGVDLCVRPLGRATTQDRPQEFCETEPLPPRLPICPPGYALLKL